ncbi:MAG: hypothetical protein EBU52_02790 [Cytophagia bacterium]|nr:hypothetical protein [Cytophagia bacterium]
MKYYFLEEAIRTSDTGTQHPQILQMDTLHDYDDDNGVYAFARISLPQNNPSLKYLLLDKDAKLTDLLSTAMLRLRGFLINTKLKHILQSFSLPTHKFYSAYVKDDAGKVHDYFWLQMLMDYEMACIDFSKSEFVIEGSNDIILLNSYQDFVSQRETLKPRRIKLRNTSFNETFKSQSLDIFKIPILSMSWIISERLMDELIKRKISGIQILEAEAEIV